MSINNNTRDLNSELHKKINYSTNNVLNSIHNLIESSNINDTTKIEDHNCLEVLSSSESISTSIDELLIITDKLRLLNKDLSFITKYRENKVELQERNKHLEAKLYEMQDLANITSNFVNEIKGSKYMKMTQALNKK